MSEEIDDIRADDYAKSAEANKGRSQFSSFNEEFYSLIRRAYKAQQQKEKNDLYKEAIDTLIYVIESQKKRNYGKTPAEIYWSLVKGFKSFNGKKASFITKRTGEKAFKEFLDVFYKEKDSFPKYTKSVNAAVDDLEKKHEKDEKNLKPVALKHLKYKNTLKWEIYNSTKNLIQEIENSDIPDGEKKTRIDALENIQKEYENFFEKFTYEPDAKKMEELVRNKHKEDIEKLKSWIEKAKSDPGWSRRMQEVHRVKSMEQELERIDQEIKSKLKDFPKAIKKYNNIQKDIEDIKSEEPDKVRTDKFAFQDDLGFGSYINQSGAANYKYKKPLLVTLKKVKEMVDKKIYNDLSKDISNLIENINFNNIAEEISDMSQELKDLLNKYKDIPIDKNTQRIENLYRKAPMYFERGLKDYFYYLAWKFIEKNKSKIDEENFNQVKAEAKEKMKNLCNNLFLYKIIRPYDKDISEIRRYLQNIKRKDVYQERNYTILSDLLNNIKKKFLTQEEKKEQAEDTKSKKGLNKTVEKSKQSYILTKFLTILKPQSNELKTRLKNVEKHIDENIYTISLSNEMIDKLNQEYEKNKDKQITDEEKIKKYLRDIEYGCRIITSPISFNNTTKKIKLPSLSNKEGYFFFSIPPQKDESWQNSSKITDPNIFVLKDAKGNLSYVNYITAIKHYYPKNMYQYVDYEPSAGLILSMNNDQYQKNFKDEAGETLALYDKDFNLISDANYRKAKYVRIKNI